jgi:predicted MFS family arabinose efflux permease
VPVAGAPELDAELVGGTLVLAMTLLSAPALLGLALEAAVLAWTDRVERRPILAGALGVMAAATVTASVAEHPLVLAAALGIWGTAAGVAEGIAEAALVSPGAGDERLHRAGLGSAAGVPKDGPASEDPDPARAMTRWGIAGAAGDLVAPMLLGAALAAGGGWRAVMLATAALPALDALAVLPVRAARARPTTTGSRRSRSGPRSPGC